jgi:hypothetical protein
MVTFLGKWLPHLADAKNNNNNNNNIWHLRFNITQKHISIWRKCRTRVRRYYLLKVNNEIKNTQQNTHQNTHKIHVEMHVGAN